MGCYYCVQNLFVFPSHIKKPKDYSVLVGRPEGKRPLGRLKRRWEDNIKIGLREIGFGGANWMQLAQIGSSGGLV
jgi:hypothetical protein